MTRIPFAEPADGDDVAAALAGIYNRKGWLPSPHRLLAHSPAALQGFEAMTDFVKSGTGLPPRLREIVVLRVSVLLHNDFEWNYHSHSALDRGLTLEEIVALRGGYIPDSFGEAECVAVRFVDQCITAEVTDACVAELRAVFTSRDIVELCTCIGYYRMAEILAAVADYAGDAPDPTVPLAPRARVIRDISSQR
jgi:4-carboxymuconolactone decarboxylase